VGARSEAAPVHLSPHPAPEFPEGGDWLNTPRPLTLAELRGKFVFLDFWTHGCINCVQNFPWVKRLSSEFSDVLVVIGVHSAKFDREKATESIRSAILRYDLDYPVYNDHDLSWWRLYGVAAWPTAVLIDPEGNIVYRHQGEGFYEAASAILEKRLPEVEGSGRLRRGALAARPERAVARATVLSSPAGIAVSGSRIYLSDTGHHRVLEIDAGTGEVFSVIGSGVPGFADGSDRDAAFHRPMGLDLGPDGNALFVADSGNHAVRRVDLRHRTVSTIAGTGQLSPYGRPTSGPAREIPLASPTDVLAVPGAVFVAMTGSHQVWVVDIARDELYLVAGSGAEGIRSGDSNTAEFAQPSALAFDPAGRLLVADAESSSIRYLDAGGRVTTLAGAGTGLFDFGLRDGTGPYARFQHPTGLAVDGDVAYVADTYNHAIRQISLETAEVRTLAGGQPGWRDGTGGLFTEPRAIAVGGGRLYIADTGNHAIRVLDPTSGAVSSLIARMRPSQYATSPGPLDEAIRLPELSATAGRSHLRFVFELPQGYKVNPDAPLAYSIATAGPITDSTHIEASHTIAGNVLDVPISWIAGAGHLHIELFVVYCENEKESVCLLETKTLQVPVRVRQRSPGDVAESAVELTVAID
jgi:DNA-binding beta-propeller fold protein YncE